MNMQMLIEHSQLQATTALGKVVDNSIIVERNVPVNIEKSQSIKAIIRHGWAQIVFDIFQCAEGSFTGGCGNRQCCVWKPGAKEGEGSVEKGRPYCIMDKSNAVSLPRLFCHCDNGSVRFLICYIFGRRPKGGGMAQVAQW